MAAIVGMRTKAAARPQNHRLPEAQGQTPAAPSDLTPSRQRASTKDNRAGAATLTKQYTSVAFGKRCGEAGVRPSMGSVGDGYDNAMAESFFSTLEAELLSRRRFASQAEARMACFSYIEGWYNPVRLHSALGYRSPMACEAEMQSATTDA